MAFTPDAPGQYYAIFVAGGIIGTSLSTYLAIADGRINRVDIDLATGTERFTCATGALTQPRQAGQRGAGRRRARCSPSAAPTETRSAPGSGVPVTTPELWDLATGT